MLQQKHFSSIDVNDIQRIQSHGLKVMRGIDGMVKAVKDQNDDLLVEKILYVARGHYRRGIKSRTEFEVHVFLEHYFRLSIILQLESFIKGRLQNSRKILDG